MENKEEFYKNVSDILGIEHEYNTPVPRRTRWNNRLIGNGRFPGFGLVRCYSSGVMIITKQHGTKTFNTYDEVYSFLKEINEE